MFTRLRLGLVGAVIWFLTSFAGCSCGSTDCGDGVVDEGETCDDGNLADGDGCSASCSIEKGCGDGVIDKGEACDDGNREAGDGCSPTCGQEGDCGNGKLEAGEACDDGNTVQYDGCEADCTESPDEVVCAELPALSEGRCAVKAGDGRRLIQGDVMTPHTVLVGGQVLIDEQGNIVCADCACEGAAGATEIHCPGAAVSPGLINSHDHITFSQNRPYTDTGERYEHRHDWRKGKNGHTKISAGGGASKDDIRWAELRFIIGGATSTIGSGSATGFLRNLDTDNQEGLSEKPVDYETFPLGDSDGTQLSSGCGYPNIASQGSIANQDAYFPHIAEGIDAFARNEFECVSGYAAGGEDLLEPQSAFIHSVGLNPLDYARMATDGTTLVWSPRSNITLYGDTALVTVAHRLGVRIVLGTDWIPTGSMNMLRELRCAADLNRDYYGGYFDDRDLWRMTTVSAAAASATDDVIGTLSGGTIADVAIFDGANATSAHEAVVAADPGDVVLVLRGGEVLYGDAAVVDALASGCDALDVCGQAQRVCASNDLGVSLAELEASAQPDYPLFFCDTPMDEPSCVPSRPSGVNGSTVYSGAASAGDQDGDGVADAEDNCPGVFNPVRPVDNGQQGDFDGDGEGDPCDVCPLDADITDCVPYDSTDSDGDGIANDADNCPNIANADQADSDMDEKGDLCDSCPDASNPGDLACVTTIYSIKKGEVSGPVALDNALVTACVNGGGFFLQAKPGDADYVGPENSGVFVYHPDTSCGANLAVGDRVSLNPATASNFFGQIQLNGATVTVEISAGETLPPFVELTTTEAGGEQANAYEGVLVEVKNAMVTDPNPMAGPGDQDPTGEFLVDGVLRVDNLMYELSPAPSLNAVFKRIAGPLAYRSGFSKIEPRGDTDVELGPPILVSFGPEPAFIREGQQSVATIPTPLEVTLSGVVEQPTFVTITSADPASLSVLGGGVTIAQGASSATVLLNGVLQAQAVKLTAVLDTAMVEATVRVVGSSEQPQLTMLSPSMTNIAPMTTGSLQVELDIPAPSGGSLVSLSLMPGTFGSVPAQVIVPVDQIVGSFDFTGIAEGTEMLTALLNGSMAQATINVTSTGGLVINEVDYDQVGTDADEFVEIYNGSAAPVSLQGIALVFVNGGGNSEYARIDLSSVGTLLGGEYLVVGSTVLLQSVPSTAKSKELPLATNNIQNGAPDAVGLLDVGASALIDALSYEGGITMGQVNGAGVLSFVEGTVLPTNVADSNQTKGSLIRFPNGTDTDDAAADWKFSPTVTPGSANL